MSLVGDFAPGFLNTNPHAQFSMCIWIAQTIWPLVRPSRETLRKRTLISTACDRGRATGVEGVAGGAESPELAGGIVLACCMFILEAKRRLINRVDVAAAFVMVRVACQCSFWQALGSPVAVVITERDAGALADAGSVLMGGVSPDPSLGLRHGAHIEPTQELPGIMYEARWDRRRIGHRHPPGNCVTS